MGQANFHSFPKRREQSLEILPHLFYNFIMTIEVF